VEPGAALGKVGEGSGYGLRGLHGVGVSVVNALSERLQVEIRRDGHVSHAGIARGAPRPARQGRELPARATGTTVTFLPDADIFETLEFDFPRSRNACARPPS
jgi:DNA gyrase subunit B